MRKQNQCNAMASEPSKATVTAMETSLLDRQIAVWRYHLPASKELLNAYETWQTLCSDENSAKQGEVRHDDPAATATRVN